MTEQNALATLKASIHDFQVRLAAANDEDAAKLLRIPVWLVKAQRAEAAELDAAFARLDAAEDAAAAQDMTDDMDWEDMGDYWGD